MSKQKPDTQETDLREWIELAINDPTSEYDDYISFELPDVRRPPAEWTEIVEDVLLERGEELRIDLLLPCVEFLVKRDIEGARKLAVVSLALERAPGVTSIESALEIWSRLNTPEKSILSARILDAYLQLPRWKKVILFFDTRLRPAIRNR